MSLTVSQAARLWAVEPRQVEPLLEQLRGDGFLTRNGQGAYLRRGCPKCA